MNIDIKPRDKNGRSHGYTKLHYSGNHKLGYEGLYLHGKEVGIWLHYSYTGNLKQKEYYI